MKRLAGEPARDRRAELAELAELAASAIAKSSPALAGGLRIILVPAELWLRCGGRPDEVLAAPDGHVWEREPLSAGAQIRARARIAAGRARGRAKRERGG